MNARKALSRASLLGAALSVVFGAAACSGPNAVINHVPDQPTSEQLAKTNHLEPVLKMNFSKLDQGIYRTQIDGRTCYLTVAQIQKTLGTADVGLPAGSVDLQCPATAVSTPSAPSP